MRRRREERAREGGVCDAISSSEFVLSHGRPILRRGTAHHVVEVPRIALAARAPVVFLRPQSELAGSPVRAASQQPHVPVIHPRPSSESESARPRPSSPPPLRCVVCARSCGAARVPPHGRARASVATRPRAARRRRRPAQELYRGELHGVHRAQPQVPVPRAPGRWGALSLRDRRVWCVAAFVRRVHEPRRATLRRRPERQSSPCVASRIRRAAWDSLLLFRISGGRRGSRAGEVRASQGAPPVASDGRFGPSPTPPIKPTRLSTPHQHYSLTSTRAARHDHRRQATGT